VLRDRYRRDPASGPELLASGPPLTRRKGHCWFLGGEADTVEELPAAVSERAERECDVVKVMATGGVITPGFLPHQSQYGPAELTAIVTTAQHHGLPTVVHAHGAQGIRDSVAAGVRSIEHCTFLDEAGVSPGLVDEGPADLVVRRGDDLTVPDVRAEQELPTGDEGPSERGEHAGQHIRGERSTPLTSRPRPVRWAVTVPGPQPTSSTGPRPVTSSAKAANGARSHGVDSRSPMPIAT
jgi:hypothetical protein